MSDASGSIGEDAAANPTVGEKPRTRRRKSLSDKQLAILEVIQRSIARARLSAEHARDRRRRRTSSPSRASPTSSTSSS